MGGLRSLWQRGGALLRRMPMVSIGGLNVLMLGVNVGISLLLVRYLPKEAYGQLVYFYAAVGLTRLLMNFGLGQYIMRELSAVGADAVQRQRVIYSALLIRGASIVVMWLGIALLNALTNQPFLFYIALAGFFASLSDVGLAVVSGLRLVAGVALIIAAQPVGYALLALGFMAVGQSSAELLMVVSALSYLAPTALAVWIVGRSGHLRRPRRADLHGATIRHAVFGAVPIYIVSLASQAYLSINGSSLGARGDFIASANYGAAFNLIAMVLGLSAATLNSVFYPQISHTAASAARAALLAQIRSGFTLMLRVYLFIAVLMASFPETIMGVLYGAQYADAAGYLVSLAPVAVLMGVAPIFVLTLLTHYRQWVVVFSLCLQTVLLLLFTSNAAVLTPSILIVGTGISSSAGTLLLLTFTIYTLRAVPFQAGDLAVIALGLVCVLVLRQVQLSVGAALSGWHIVAGLVFMLVYWSSWLISGKLRWASSPS